MPTKYDDAAFLQHQSRWRDGPAGYGFVSRWLHWIIAVLFAWQFTSALLHFFADETPLAEFFFGWHFSVGASIWLLVLLNGLWAMLNLGRGPAHRGSPALRRAASIGHLALYLLMIAVPTLGLLRAWGSKWGLEVFGIRVFEPRDPEIEWTQALGGALHGELGWVLLALVAGHIFMALWHGYVRRDDTLRLMWGGRARAR